MVIRSILTCVTVVTLVLGTSTMEGEIDVVSRIQRVPQLSTAAESSKGASGLLNYWRSCNRDAAKLGQTGVSGAADSAMVRLVIAPKTQLLSNIAPQGSNKHPLYRGTPESKALKADIVLDSLSEEAFPPALLEPNAELALVNLNEKNFQFRTDDQGKLSVNGVPGEVVFTGPDGFTVVCLDDFIFDHRQRMQEIFSGANSH